MWRPPAQLVKSSKVAEKSVGVGESYFNCIPRGLYEVTNTVSQRHSQSVAAAAAAAGRGLCASRHQSGWNTRRRGLTTSAVVHGCCSPRTDDEWLNDVDACRPTSVRCAYAIAAEMAAAPPTVINNRRHDSRNRFAAINPTLSIIIRHFVPPLAHVTRRPARPAYNSAIVRERYITAQHLKPMISKIERSIYLGICGCSSSSANLNMTNVINVQFVYMHRAYRLYTLFRSFSTSFIS